jgi:Cu-Zn family superoxide dismutase
MKRLSILALALAPVLAGCQTVAEQPVQEVGRAILQQAGGQPAGTARMLSNGTEVTLSLALSGLTPGLHGVHLHMAGRCEGPTFASAGAHLNPTGHQHGSANPAGAHLGDLPNAVIGAAGSGSLSASLVGSPAEVLSALFDADGTAIVVHADPDDYRTDPSGNSGTRIACGVLTRG